jgi:UDP-N-acetylmuramoyl-L-alanyl-D-glutamate--2,6-diaminopimelate ligase
MTLTDLLSSLPEKKIYGPAYGPAYGSADREIAGIAYDSRRLKSGDLFVAIRGLHHDGRRYIPEAIAKGAAAVVVDREEIHGSVITIQVDDARKALALLSARWYDYPARKLRLVGITGTDGKTTTAYLVHAILRKAGFGTGLIGTVVTRIGQDDRPSFYTTPESLELHQALADMVSQGDAFAVMEVSSHALAMDRVHDIPFELAIFTNLSRDHLDFHGDFEHYRDAKALLFERLHGSNAKAIINLDDPSASFFMDKTTVPVITYSAEGEADISLKNAHLTMQGTDLEARTPFGLLQIHAQLLGRYNVFNILASIGAGVALELPADVIRRGLEGVSGVDGRFEIIRARQGFTVIVDYAHTPQALQRLLSAIQEMSPQRVLLIFGCGGDRDRGKRPEMADVASQMSDMVILTTDNPRSEDPLSILREVQRGILPGTNYEVVPDRREAIRRGLMLTRPGEVLVVAGRGHERYQIVGSERRPFQDRATVLEELERLEN